MNHNYTAHHFGTVLRAAETAVDIVETETADGNDDDVDFAVAENYNRDVVVVADVDIGSAAGNVAAAVVGTVDAAVSADDDVEAAVVIVVDFDNSDDGGDDCYQFSPQLHHYSRHCSCYY